MKSSDDVDRCIRIKSEDEFRLGNARTGEASVLSMLDNLVILENLASLGQRRMACFLF